MPTEQALKKSLGGALVNVNRSIHLDEKDQVDACCRSLYKSDAYKRISFNQINDSLWNFQSCDCIHLFQICVDNLNTSLSNEVEFLHSINTTKCYLIDYPIIQCIKWESYPESETLFLRFVNQVAREKFHNRCSKYELDGNQPKQLQLRDLPFNHHSITMRCLQTFHSKQSIFKKVSFFHANFGLFQRDFLIFFRKMYNLFLYPVPNDACIYFK